jgi:hypothetical protein
MPQFEHTRMSIDQQLTRVLALRGRTMQRGDAAGRLVSVVDGRTYTPKEAANAFLPGGWAGSFGRSRADLDAALDTRRAGA